MKKRWVLAVILLSCAAFLALKLKIDDIPRTKVPGSSIIYVPSGKSLQYASFGNTSVMADLIYLWAIQYYGNYTIKERFDYLEHIFGIISELDPLYLDPYEVGALIAVFDAKDYELAYRILAKGLENNPDQWIFPFEAGHYAQMYEKDFTKARKFYEQAMAIEGAPAQTERLAANAAFQMMDLETAWKSWMEIYQAATDERIKKIAENHLYNVKASRDIQILEEAVRRYTEQFDGRPPDLNALVTGGLLNTVPKDLDEKDYIYDPETGEIRTATLWSKR